MVLLLAFSVPVGPAAVPAAAQETTALVTPNLVVDDPVGDQVPAAMLPLFSDSVPVEVPVPSNPALATYEQIDITRLEVGNEDSVTFQFILDVVGFAGTAATATQAAALVDATCSLTWTYLHDDPDVVSTHRIGFSTTVDHIPGGDPGISRPNWYWSHREDGGSRRYSYSGWNGADIVYESDEGRFVITVYKSFVPVWPGGHDPATGDTLVPLLVYCATDPTALGALRIMDSVALDGSTTYAFQSPNAGDVVHVRYLDQGEDDADAIDDAGEWGPPQRRATMPASTVVAGAPSVIPVVVSNNADGRKLIQLRAEFEDDAPAQWNVTLTPSIMVPGNGARTVNLIVTPASTAPVRTEHTIRVSAEATGESHTGAVSRLLRVGPVLDATANTFHIHTRPIASGDPAVETVFGPRYEVTASLLESLDDYDDAPVVIPITGGWSDGDFLDPLARSVRLDKDDPVEASVAFQGDPAATIRVGMILTTDQDEIVFHIDQEVPGDGITDLTVLMPEDAPTTLEAGHDLYFVIGLSRTNTGENTGDIRFDPSGSSFSLPVVQRDQVISVTDGRFLPSLALAEDEESTTYVNPGKAYAFDLVLANDGIETDDLALRVNATNATDWVIDIMPGARFRIAPGNATPVSVVVRAPDAAKEGDRAAFEVTAQSTHDAAVRTRLDLDAIVTTGVDVDEKAYTPKDGEIDPLAEERGASPGPGATALLLVAGALAMAARRRR